MTGKRLPSIKISDIDPEQCYFNPGCAINICYPDSGPKILEFLNAHFGPVEMHTICCHYNPQLPHGSTIISNCAGCDLRLGSLYAGIRTITLWEVLDSIENLPLPAYNGLQLSVHDSCVFRSKPQIPAAIRSLLRKMNVQIVESKHSGTKSICCGDNFYPKIPIEEVAAFQKKRAAQMPCQDVAVSCVSCIKSMAIGGKTPRHMIDLILKQETDPGDTRIDLYHEAIKKYRSEHSQR